MGLLRTILCMPSIYLLEALVSLGMATPQGHSPDKAWLPYTEPSACQVWHFEGLLISVEWNDLQETACYLAF